MQKAENSAASTKVIVGEVRLSYCHLFTPEAITPGQDPKYSVSLLIPKSNKELVLNIAKAIQAALIAGAGKFGGKMPAKGTWKNPLRDGDIERASQDEYKGCYFINASSKTKPGLVKKGTVSKFTEITDETELYSGCYGYVSVNFFAYNSAGNKGIGAGLNNVLKSKDGDYLGGRASADSDFADLDLPDSVDNAVSGVGDMPDFL